ncbi:MAG: YebC/PmpR family DNA-binding transcriptional regulator [Bacilli bacterium]
MTYLPQNNEYVTLSGEEKEYFDRLLVMLDEIDDVQNVYHNVALD